MVFSKFDGVFTFGISSKAYFENTNLALSSEKVFPISLAAEANVKNVPPCTLNGFNNGVAIL